MIETISGNESKRLKESYKMPLVFVGILWLIHLFQIIFKSDLGYLGIYPREFFGLKGIFAAPLIHGDFSHLLSNSIPVFVLGTLIFYFYKRVALRSIIMIYLLTGLAVWLLARSVFHIGASGVVYGMVTFMLGNGLFRRNMKSVVLALIVLFFYSGMFVGVLPNQEGISWESHLYGAFVGLFTAFYYKEEIEVDEVEDVPFWEHADAEEENSSFFLDRDVFEKTREERLREQENPPDWTSTNTWW